MIVPKTAYKYAFSKTKGHRASSIMIVLGVAVSVMAVIVSSGIMNGLQYSQLRHIRNVESFDIIVKTKCSTDEIRNIDGVNEAFVFSETAAVLEDKLSGRSISCRIRGIENNFFDSDRVFESLRFNYSSDFPENSIILSTEMRRSLRLIDTDEITATLLKRGKAARLIPSKVRLSSKYSYLSAIPEFNSSTAFMSLNNFLKITGTDDSSIGIYTESDNAGYVVEKIKEIDSSAEIITWQQYNNATYSALMLEKTLMYVFLGFVFLIVCVNLKNSTVRLIKTKQKEAAILRTFGCTRLSVCGIFVFQALIISLSGVVTGTFLGVAVINNIGSIFSFIDIISGGKTVFSQLRINALISSSDICIISVSVVILAVLFASLSCIKLFRKEIMEVILDLPD